MVSITRPRNPRKPAVIFARRSALANARNILASDACLENGIDRRKSGAGGSEIGREEPRINGRGKNKGTPAAERRGGRGRNVG